MRTRGWLDSLILAVAADAPVHGYGIASKLQESGIGDPAVASLYPILKRLEAEGCLKADWDSSGTGPARKVYCITEAGTTRLKADIEEWQIVRTGLDELFATATLPGSPQ